MTAQESGDMAQAMALRALARREYARAELIAHLGARGIARETAAVAVDALAARGLQSDERYAQALVAARRRRGYGPARLAAELGAAGLTADIVRAAVAADAPEWIEACRRWCDRYGRGLDALALARKARARGFTAAQVRAALGQRAKDAP